MNIEVCLRWADELESSQYQQSMRVLKINQDKNTVRHCAIGVLCDIYDRDVMTPCNKTLWKNIGGSYFYYGFNYSTECVVSTWAGLSDDLLNTVIHFNDGIGCSQRSFIEIARFIRSMAVNQLVENLPNELDKILT